MSIIFKYTIFYLTGADIMRKRAFFTAVGIIATLLIVFGFMLYYNIRFMPMKITESAQNAISDTQKLKLLDKIYDANFIFDRTSVNTAKVYLPRYSVTEEQTAVFYARLFDFNGICGDYDDYFLYTNGSEELYIDKYSGYIRYENNSVEASSEDVGEEAIIVKSKQFINNKILSMDYEKLAVNSGGGKYTVKLISDLSGYNNYAFPVVLTFNAKGDLASMDFYYFEYDTIDTVNLKTMKQAFGELPIDFEEGVKVDLKSCKIVYIYEESIVQPAYLFEGEITEGKTFQCFVKAAKYNR